MDRFLTGTIGSRRASSLAQTLNEQTLAGIKEKFSALDPNFNKRSYSPWMTCSRRLEYFIKNAPAEFHGTSGAQQSEIIHTPNELNFLHLALSESKSGDLSYVRNDLTDWRVMSSDDSDLPRFLHDTRQAKDWLSASGDPIKRRLEGVVLEIVPVSPLEGSTSWRRDGVGMSSHQYRGGIFLGLPEKNATSEMELAINLSHELGHQTLMVYQQADPLLVSDYGTPVFSAIRKTERPALMSFHAVAALVSMAEFLSGFVTRKPESEELGIFAEKRLNDVLSDLRVGVEALKEIRFTDLGKQILDEARAWANGALSSG